MAQMLDVMVSITFALICIIGLVVLVRTGLAIVEFMKSNPDEFEPDWW